MSGGLSLPPPYRAVPVGGALLVARPEALEPARRAIAEAGSLLAHAAAHPEARALESRRGLSYRIPGTDGHWVVRHYRRGSALTRWLADRYLRVGVPRPLRELTVSHAARERGVDTPQVVALALYPAGPFYRADLATAYVPCSTNLAQALFGAEAKGAADRVQALAAAGRLVRTLHERGVVHVDLTLQNVVLEWTTRPPRPFVLDLDDCRLLPGALPAWRRGAMLRRFARSLRGWEERSGRTLSREERAAFRTGYHGGDG